MRRVGLILLIALAALPLSCGKADIERLERENNELSDQVQELEEKIENLEEQLATAKEAAEAAQAAALAVPPALDSAGMPIPSPLPAGAPGAAPSAGTPGAVPAAATLIPTGAVTLTRIATENGKYNVTINNAITIRGVEIKQGSSGEFLATPQRFDEGQYWPYVSINRSISPQFLQQVKSNQPGTSAAALLITSVRVNKLQSPRGKTKAFVDFEFNNGAVKIHSWTIVQGQNDLFLGSPREMVGEEWKDVVYAANRDFMNALTQAALAEYNKR